MNTHRPHRVPHLAGAALLALAAFAPVGAHGQFASLLNTNARYAGNSTGTAVFSGDSGSASATSLNAPTFAVFDTTGNFFISDTANNCVRKISPTGAITTVAGLRVSGAGDTCNTVTNATPSPTQGLLRPTGLAIDSANTLYIADSLHNCVRTLAAGAVDSFAANALTTVAGTCTSVDTASVTPVPSGLAVDSGLNLYIAVRDSLAAQPVNQIVKHVSGTPATAACYLAGQPSAAVPTACAGVSSTVTLASPGGVMLDTLGNLFFADTGNNCVRELAVFAIQQTAVGQCLNDHTGNSLTALASPFGLAFAPSGALLISESAVATNNVVSFQPGSGALSLVAGLPSGTAGPYLAATDGQSSLSSALNTPLGLTTDSAGNIYLADSANNIVRELTPGIFFPSTAVGTPGGVQVITVSINQAANLSVNLVPPTGSDYIISSTTCTGVVAATLFPAPPTTCNVNVRFNPSLPGTRNGTLQVRDSISAKTVTIPLYGTGVGPLALFTPGVVNTIASGIHNGIGMSVDSAGNTYVLEQGNGFSTADVLRYAPGSGTPTTVVAQGAGLVTATALAVDAAGNVYVADASTRAIARFGADGSVNTTYVTGLTAATAIQIDAFGNLFVAQSGNAHNILEVYAAGTRRVVAGSGTNASADGVAAASALFVAPSGLTLMANGGLYVTDASGHRVYLIDPAGIIHIAAGNGTTSSSAAGQATGTALLTPVSTATDPAGDLYIADQAANRIYEVLAVPVNGNNIATVLGTGIGGYTGDGGVATAATVQLPLGVALNSLGQIEVLDTGNGALREISFPTAPMLSFGDIIVSETSAVRQQGIVNVGNGSLQFTLPFTTTDSHYAVSASSPATTCGMTVAPGATCVIGVTFSPTSAGTITAQATLASNSPNSPQAVLLTAYGLFTQPLPYTLMPQAEVYGQSFAEVVNINLVYPDLVPTGTITYFLGGKQLCSVTGNFPNMSTCQAVTSGLGVGTYLVNFVYTTGDISYYSTTGTTTLTISPASLTVTPANVAKLYGAAIPTLPTMVTGSANGDLFLPSTTTTATAASPVGVYPITATVTGVGLASLNNYTVTYNTGTLTVNPVPLTLTVNNATRQYGAANPTFTSTFTGSANGDVFTVAYSTSAGPGSPVGSYLVTATVTGSNSANYNITVVPGTLTVTPAPLTLSIGSATRQYGVANPTFTSTTTGALNGDSFTIAYTTSATITSPVGTYPITGTVGGPAAANYTVTVVPGTLTITQSTAPVVVTANNATRVYGAANPAFSSSVSGALNGDTFTVSYATAATPASPVGTYAIVPTLSGAALANYANVSAVNGTLTVTPAALVITANNATRLYGAANPAFTGTVVTLLNGDTATVAFSTPATAGSPVGSYAITPGATGAALANYTVSFVSGTLTVTAAPLTVTVVSASRPYGVANPTFTATFAGVANGDTFTSTFVTPATIASPVGSYPVTDTIAGANLANYTVTLVPGTLTITQSTAALTFSANNASRVYGTANPAFAGTITGALNGDTFTVSYATTASATSAVGSYAIVPTVSGAALANYSNIVIANGTLSVTPAALTVTAANATRIYGAANPTFTSTTAGALNGDTFTVGYTTSATVTSPVGTYAVVPTVSGTNIGNYTVNAVSGTLTVTPAALSVSVANASRPYGTANPTFSATIAGALNGDTFTNNFSTTATIASPPGTYPLNDSLTGTAAANYTITIVPGTLTITQATATLNIAANSAGRTYGAANPSFSYTATGALNGDTFTVTYATAATATSPVGTYTIVPTVSGAALANYASVTTTNGTLTITPAAATVTVANATRPYGAANPTFTSATSGLFNGDTLSIAYTTTATATSPAGTYPITAAVTGASNYTVTTVAGTLTVTPAATSAAVTTSASPVQFGTMVTFSAAITSAAGPVTGTVLFFDGATQIGSGTVNGSGVATFATSTLAIGTHIITATYQASGNFGTSSGSVTEVVNPVATPLTVTIGNASRVYGAANPAFSSTVAGALNGDTFTVTYATAAGATSPIGSYPITATVSGANIAAYTVTVVPGTLTVTPATLTVTANNATRQFGQANPVFTGTVTGVMNGDAIAVSYATTATASSPVGQYPIVPTVSGTSNYTVMTNNGTLTITPVTTPLTVTIANVTRVYGAANPAFSSTIAGALNGDTFTVTYTTSATSGSGIGSYPITATVSGANIAAYTVTVVPGTLTVTPAALTVTANNATRTFGTANPSFTGTIAGLVNGDAVTATYTTTATLSSPVGTYPIVPTLSGTALANYTVVANNGTLTITPATTPLTVTVSNAARLYGSANPTFTSTIAGLLNGDTVTVAYATTATAASPVGTYPITATVSGAATANYVITVVPGTLTVTPAPLTVTAASATRLFGVANPTFTGTIAGLLNGDTVTATYTTTATIASPVGSYPIVPAVSGAAAANYTVALNNGTLTVTAPIPTPLLVTVSSATRLYGAANPAFASTITGALNGDTFTVTYATTASVLSPVGTYPVTATLTGTNIANYIVTVTPGTLTVTPAPLTIAAASATRAFGVANPTFTGTITGLVNGDVVTASYATTATIASPAGTYPIVPTAVGAAASNYAVTLTNGTLTITAGATTVALTTSATPVQVGTAITFTATVTSPSGVPSGTVLFFDGATQIGSTVLSPSGVATAVVSNLLPGTHIISATYQATPNFATAIGTLTQVVNPGVFTLTATPPNQFVRGPGTTGYQISAVSTLGFAGTITLTCAGLPADASCTFTGGNTITLTAGGTGSTSITLVNTAADAALVMPTFGAPGRFNPGDLAPVTAAAVFPFEISGLGAFLAGLLRRPGRRQRAKRTPSRIGRLLMILLLSSGVLGLAGCGCFTSVYQTYNVVITGTSTVPGTASQSVTIALTVAAQ